MIVDFHTHWYPKAYLERLVALGRSDLAGARSQPPDFSARIEEMDRVGVAKQVLSFVGLNVELPEAQAAVEAARLLNDIYCETRAKYPGRVEAFGKAPLPFVDAAVAETVRCMDTLGCIGMALPASISGHVLDDPNFDPFWLELDQRAAIAFIHPVGGDSGTHWGMGEYGLDALFGSPMQTAIAATRLVFSGVTRRFPNIRFLLAQGGGVMPIRWHPLQRVLALGRSGHVPVFLDWTKALDLDPADLMHDFRLFYYDTSMMDSPATLALCKESFGANRMVLGSDTAFGSLTGIVEHIRGSEILSAQEKTTMLETNGMALFGAAKL
jgi:predicted TIM-barrel fold metal-dependent hydrolase